MNTWIWILFQWVMMGMVEFYSLSPLIILVFSYLEQYTKWLVKSVVDHDWFMIQNQNTKIMLDRMSFIQTQKHASCLLKGEGQFSPYEDIEGNAF